MSKSKKQRHELSRKRAREARKHQSHIGQLTAKRKSAEQRIAAAIRPVVMAHAVNITQEITEEKPQTNVPSHRFSLSDFAKARQCFNPPLQSPQIEATEIPIETPVEPPMIEPVKPTRTIPKSFREIWGINK